MESEPGRSPDPDAAATVAELLRLRPRLITPKKGDLVWAKPKTNTSPWLPALVTNLNNSSVSISFFGRRRPRRFPTSQILPFEENYAKMIPTVGELSDEITLALDELGRRSASSFLCPCRTASVESIGPEKRFEPTEILGFVLDVAVRAWIDEGCVAGAVRASAQVVAYQNYASARRSAGVRARFRPERILDFISRAAISSRMMDDEVVHQIVAYRRFVRVHLDWVYRWDFGIEDGFLSEESAGNGKEMPSDHSCGNGEPCEVSKVLEDNFFVKMNRDNFELLQEQVHHGMENCVLNTQDFSILDHDEKYEYPPVDESAAVSFCNGSVGNIGSKKSYGGNYFGKSDEGEACHNGVSLATDAAWRGGTGSEFSAVGESTGTVLCEDSNQVQEIKAYCQISDRQSGNVVLNELRENIAYLVKELIACHWASDPALQPGNGVGCSSLEENTENHKVSGRVIQSGNNIVLESIPETTLPGEKINLRLSTADECKINKPTTLPVSFSDDCLEETAGCLRRQVPSSCGSKCDSHSRNEISTHDEEFSSRHTAALIVNRHDGNESGNLNISSSLSASSEISRKRRPDQTIFSSPCKLQKMTRDKKIECSGPSMEHLSSNGCEPLSNTEVIVANDTSGKSPMVNASNNILKFYSADEFSNFYYENIKMGSSCVRSSCSSKSSKHCQNAHYQSNARSFPKWDDFYASPLTKDVLKSPSEAQKSSYVKLPKSLHMKFPKDFNLPTKGELEKKFSVFGPLDLTSTKVYFYTGAGQVVFLDQYDADVAYKYAKRKNLFGHANVRFWLDEHENFRKVQKSCDLSAQIVGCSSLNLKSCLKSPSALKESNQKKGPRVRFLTQNQLISLSPTNMLKNEASSLSICP